LGVLSVLGANKAPRITPFPIAVPVYKNIVRSLELVSRPALLPKPIGRSDAGAISLGFERHHGFYELACARLRPPGIAVEYVSRDFGYIADSRRSSRPPARRERKIALLVFFLMLENAALDKERDLMEIARGGPHSWCHSLYRLSVHNPKEGAGNKWLGDAFGLENEHLDDPFRGILRFVQCRRVGQKFIVHLDSKLFDPDAVVLSVWEKGGWQQSSKKQRAELLYDLMRQVPRWAPLAAKLHGRSRRAASEEDVQLRGPWEDMPLYFRYITAAKRVRLVGLNHQVFRRGRATWMQEQGDEQVDSRNIAVSSTHESPAECERRIAGEINATNPAEPFDDDLEELTVFIGSPVAHRTWERNTGWRPEPYQAVENFWQDYLKKLRRLRPRAKISLYAIDDVSPLALHLEFSDGSAFLKWTPAMFGAYHPGNPGWNLLWNLGAPPPPHFQEIVAAMTELTKRATALPI
jgi:hypothetical protein